MSYMYLPAGLLRPDSREDRLLHMMKQIEENGWSMDHCQLYDFSTANTYRIALTSKIRECPVPGTVHILLYFSSFS